MSEKSPVRTYHPEYANLPVKENSLSGYKGRKCPDCDKLGSVEKKIALERDDGKYSQWTVYRCRDCDELWRTRSRWILTTVCSNPGALGYEVVGHE